MVKKLVQIFYARKLITGTKANYGKNKMVLNVKPHNAYS